MSTKHLIAILAFLAFGAYATHTTGNTNGLADIGNTAILAAALTNYRNGPGNDDNTPPRTPHG